MAKKIKRKPIPIIDLFAGPGGLGEGFTSVVDDNNERYFKIALSIEKDDFAHQTLTLRSFLRQFPFKKLPKEYYEFIRGEISLDNLYEAYPNEIKEARNEAWKTELGTKTSHSLVDEKITQALKGEKDFIVIGGPPCQAYSLVGRARRQEADGLKKDDVRVYLYREYYRILAVHSPMAFIMENVKGLLSSKVDNSLIFNDLISDLMNPVESYKKLHGKNDVPYTCPGYNIYSLVSTADLFTSADVPTAVNPKDFIIKAEEYGVPQTRHRVILLGIRKDIDAIPKTLQKASEKISVEKVLYGLPNLRSGLSKIKDDKQEWKSQIQHLLALSIRKEIDKDVWRLMEETIDNLTLPQKDRGGMYIEYLPKIKYNEPWYIDDRLNGVMNHETRSHILEDIYRYLFASCFAKIYKRSPKLSDFPPSLLPDHDNVDLGIKENKFADRFRVQLSGEPSKTITSHISKDGHYYIHYDASQCRSLTVREAARIQTFPDNYYFCGPRTEQYHQVGNAVPPFLAFQIAEIVKDIL